jgi:hypothetical protein
MQAVGAVELGSPLPGRALRPHTFHDHPCCRVDHGQPVRGRCQPPGYQRQQPAQQGPAADGETEIEIAAVHPDRASHGNHLHGPGHHLVEGVRLLQQVCHPAIGSEQHAVPAPVLDHHVGELAPGAAPPPPHDDAYA